WCRSCSDGTPAGSPSATPRPGLRPATGRVGPWLADPQEGVAFQNVPVEDQDQVVALVLPQQVFRVGGLPLAGGDGQPTVASRQQRVAPEAIRFKGRAWRAE